MIIQSSYVCDEGIKTNEDRIRVLDTAAYVLDGATGKTDKHFSKFDTDTIWFVEEWDMFLKSNIESDKDLVTIIKEGILFVNDKWSKLTNDTLLEKREYPSSGISIVRLKTDKIETFTLGDCHCAIKTRDGVDYLKLDELENLDKISTIALNKELKKGKTYFEARLAIKDLLNDNRSKLNTKDGYWVLSKDIEAVDHALVKEYKENEVSEILLMSDGYHCIVDYLLTTTDDIFKFINNETVIGGLKKLRQIENEDYNLMKYPRLKKSDDSSCIHLVLGGIKNNEL